MTANQKTVLVAEDMESSLMLYTDVLEEAGYQVVKAKNGVEALDAISKQPVDLLLTDAKMPEMNALDIIPRIRALKPEMPIIVVTAYPVLAEAFHNREFKVEALFLKPVQITDLLKKIEELLENK
jgi:CheY-like chemotaxis protein